MIKLPLKKNNKFDNRQFPWASCLPFVENSRGILIHRPRSVSTYNTHKHPHIGIGYWCGNHVSGGKNFTFIEAPQRDGKFLCARCEMMAVKHGLPSADELAGYHVHLGGLVAVKLCCPQPRMTETESNEQKE